MPHGEASTIANFPVALALLEGDGGRDVAKDLVLSPNRLSGPGSDECKQANHIQQCCYPSSRPQRGTKGQEDPKFEVRLKQQAAARKKCILPFFSGVRG